MTTMYDFDLTINSITTRENAKGTWVDGTIDQRYRFHALVFAEHAESEEYELERSCVSKLWVRDTTATTTVFHFGRGLDIPAASDEVRRWSTFCARGSRTSCLGKRNGWF
jgi:hypothetical protein